MEDFIQTAANVGMGITGGIFGIEATRINNELAKQREAIARAENFKYNEMSADAADARTRNLYKDLQSPQALMRQYEEAGLSPSLMAAGAAGGTVGQGAQGNGASGINPQTFGIDPLTGAQIAKTMAETNLIKEQTRTEAGDNERGQAQVADILADAGLKDASENLKRTENAMRKLELDIAETNKPLAIKRYKDECANIAYNAQKACAEAITAFNTAQVSTETLQDQITAVREQNKNLIADTALKYAHKNLTEQEIKESESRIWTMVEQLAVDWVNASANEKKAEALYDYYEAKLPYMEQELELEAQRLDIEETRVWVEGTAHLIHGLAETALIFTSAKGGGMREVGMPKPDLKPKSWSAHQNNAKAYRQAELRKRAERRGYNQTYDY